VFLPRQQLKLARGAHDKEHAMSQTAQTAVAVIGIDIGKNSFHIVGHDERGAIVLRQKWSRGQVEARFANLPPCLIGMEACVGAHYLSRKLNGLGHDARLMPAKYVRPYSKGQKNDFRDAEAIAEAVQRPTMKFVATKTADQLDLQALHRVRERLVSQRTGIVNQIRAFLLERGIAVRQGQRFLRAELPRILATPPDVLSPRMARVIEDLAGDWRRLDERIEGLSAEIGVLARADSGCERLMSVPGSGRSSPARWWLRSALVMPSPKAATSRPGWGLFPSRCRPATAQSSARYQSAVIAICASCSCRRPGLC
jgi:transposase